MCNLLSPVFYNENIFIKKTFIRLLNVDAELGGRAACKTCARPQSIAVVVQRTLTEVQKAWIQQFQAS